MYNRDLNKASTLCFILGGGLAVILAALLPWAVKDSLDAVKLICVFFIVVQLLIFIT